MLAKNILIRYNNKLSLVAARLEGLSPLKILERGYSVTRTENNVVVKSTEQLSIGNKLKTNLAEGIVFSEVIEIEE